MVLKAVFLLFVLTVSQVFAISIIQLRSLDILASRQTVCPICTTVSNAISACTGTSAPATCACSATISAGAQACITCGVATAPTPGVICASQGLIDAYADLCPGSPALKLPPGITKPTGCPSSSSLASKPGPLAAGLAVFDS